jgi:hypothetical protein
VGVHPGQLAAHPDLVQVVAALEQEARFRAPGHRILVDLDELVALLEALSAHLDHPRPPFRIARGAPDEVPDDLDRSVYVRLLPERRHASISLPQRWSAPVN